MTDKNKIFKKLKESGSISLINIYCVMMLSEFQETIEKYHLYLTPMVPFSFKISSFNFSLYPFRFSISSRKSSSSCFVALKSSERIKE